MASQNFYQKEYFVYVYLDITYPMKQAAKLFDYFSKASFIVRIY